MSQMIKASEAAANQLMLQLRMMSQPHLAQVPGHFVGIVLQRPSKDAAEGARKDPSWQVFPFGSLKELEDWYGDWLGNEWSYAYLAAIDRTQSMDPILEAGFGQRRTRMSNPGAMISGQQSPRPFDALRELVAKHETYWAAIAQYNPRNERMRRFMTHEWDPFYRSWTELVARHGLNNDDLDVIKSQLEELNRIRHIAFKNEIPVPDVVSTGSDRFVVSGGAVLRPGGGGGGFHHGGGGFHRPFPRPRPYGGYPRGFGGGGYYDGYYGDVYDPYVQPVYVEQPVYVLPYGEDPNLQYGQYGQDPYAPQLAAPAPGGVEVSGWFDTITDKVKSAVSSIRHEVTHPGDLLRHATHAVLHPADSIKKAAQGLGAGAGLAKVISYAADPLQDLTENAQVQQMVAARYGGPIGSAALSAANAIDSGQNIAATMKTLAPQIAQTAVTAAAAKSGPAAAGIAGALVHASANTPTSPVAQKAIDFATQLAATDPDLKAALDAAHAAVVASAAAHHVMATTPTPAQDATVSGWQDHRSPAPTAPPQPPVQTAQHPYGRSTPMPQAQPHPPVQTAQHPYGRPTPAPTAPPAQHPFQTAQHPYGRPSPAPTAPPPARPRAPAYDHRPAPAPYVRDQRPSAPYARDHRSGVPTTRPSAPYVRDHRSSVPTRAEAPPPYHGWQAPPPSSHPFHHGHHRHWGGWGRGGYYRPGARYPGRWVRGARGPVWLESDQNLLIPDDQPLDFPDMAPPTTDAVPLTVGDPNDQTTIVPGDEPGTVVRMDAPTDAGDGVGDAPADDQGYSDSETGTGDNGDVSSFDSGASDDASDDAAVTTQGEIMYTPLSNALIMCGKILAPISEPLRITTEISPNKIMTVTLFVGGRSYQAHADVSELLAGALAGVRSLHDYLHSSQARALVGGANATDVAVGSLRDAIVGKLVEEHQNAIVGGWLDDIGHAVKSAAVGVKDGALAVHHAVAGTVQKFKGPITVVATAVATAYGGPLAGAAAAKFAGPIIDGVANVGKPADKHAAAELAQAHQAAKSDPVVAKALQAAKSAVANTVAGYHIKQTIANAAAGNPNAKAQVADLAAKARTDNPAAKSAWDIATGIVADAASSYISSKAAPSKLSPEEEAQIEIDPPATVSGAMDPRALARHAAMMTNGNVIGVVIPKDNPIQVKVFASSDDADDWYGQWLAVPHAFEYVAYYDRGDQSFPTPLNETIGRSSGAKASGFLGGVALPFLSGGATAYLLSKLGQRVAPLAPPPPPAPVVHSLSTAPGTAPGPTGNTTVSGAALFPFLAGVGIGAGGYLGGEKLYRYYQEHKGAPKIPTKASGSPWGATAMYGAR